MSGRGVTRTKINAKGRGAGGGGGAPSGAAGGSLSGTYPNPAVDHVEYATITIATADANDAGFLWPSSGKKYKVTTFGNGVLVLGVYTETFTNDAGQIVIRPNGPAEILLVGGSTMMGYAEWELGALSEVSIGAPFNLSIKSTGFNFDSIPYGDASWVNLDMRDPSIVITPGCYIKNLIGSYNDAITFTDASQYIDELNPGSDRIIAFSKGGTSYHECYIDSGLSHTPLGNEQNKYITYEDSTFETTLTDSAISGTVLTVPDGYGRIHMDLSAPGSVDQIVCGTSQDIRIDNIGSNTCIFSTGANLLLPTGSSPFVASSGNIGHFIHTGILHGDPTTRKALYLQKY